MAHKGKRKRSKTSSIAVSQGWLICSASCPSPSSCPKWLSHNQHLREDLQTPAPASFSLRALGPEQQNCEGAAVAEFGPHPGTSAPEHCSSRCQLEQGPCTSTRRQESLCLRGRWGRCLYLLSGLLLDFYFTLTDLGGGEIDCGKEVAGSEEHASTLGSTFHCV